MSECTVRIKKLKTAEHMFVTPEYASRTKMLKNSGWVVADLPGEKQETKLDELQEFDLEEDELIQDGQDEFNEKPLDKGSPIDTFDEALTEKETGLTLDEQQPKEDTVDLLGGNQEVEEDKKIAAAPKRRGRQPGSTNKTK